MKDFNVERYLGRWYEIGSTALYKFQYERGLICDHTIHSLLVPRTAEHGPVLSILGRGYQTLTPLESAGVAHLSGASQGVCSNARTICALVAPNGLLRETIPQLAETIAIIRNDSVMRHRAETENLVTDLRNLRALANTVQISVDKLSRNISRLQALNANISQGAGDTQHNIIALMEESSSIDTNIQSLNLHVSESIANLRAEIAQGANFIRVENPDLASRLDRSILALGAEFGRIETSLAGIAMALTGVSASSRALAGLPTSPGGPAPSLPAREVRGVALQNPDARGKLELHQYGAPSQYWVLDVERSENSRRYDAVLVYSCIDHGLDGVLPLEHLFVLAKNRTLAPATVNMFLETARRYGIYSECDNPFVTTVQHGTCGWPDA